MERAQADSPVPARTRARLYRTLRSAHLEQALQLSPAVIVFGHRRYDFDEQLAARLDLVQAGPVAAASFLVRSGVREVEVNEPLMRGAVRGTAVTVAGLRLRGRLKQDRVLLVGYGIENLDPFRAPVRTPRAAASRALDRALTRYVWGQLDRFAYGTDDSRALYARLLGPFAHPEAERLVPALPQPCDCPPRRREPGSVLFLGAFSARKGFPLLHAAWPAVRREHPAGLTLVGQGALADEAVAWAAQDPSVRVDLDPPRARVHAALRRAQVLVLPSQPQPRWREQIGRPLLEALAHGCSVVTTTETGMASWLAAHDHSVLPADATAGQLAVAIGDQLRRVRPVADVLADLPTRDGRLAADDWLFPD